MSNNRSVQVHITGLKELKRELRRANNELADGAFREANKQVSELVATEAKRRINSKSGTLAKHTRAAPTKKLARVRSGTKAIAPYAGVNHYLHNNYAIQAIKRLYPRIDKTYTKAVNKIMRRI